MATASVLSGYRNFEARVHQEYRGERGERLPHRGARTLDEPLS